MTEQKRAITLIAALAMLGPGETAGIREVKGAEPSPAPGSVATFAPNDTEARSYRLANRHILRVVTISGGRLVTKEIGLPKEPVAVRGGDEFAVVIGPDRKRLTAADFRVASAEPAKGRLSIVLQHPATGLTATVQYRLGDDDFYLRKTVTFRNDGKAPVQILDVEVESLRFSKARALGLGKPVYADDKLFLGLEFPLGQDRQNDGLVSLGHLPGRALQPGESLVTKTAVIGTASEKETVEEAFDRYIRRIALRKPEVMTVYGNWARYDYLSDGVWPDEKMVLETVEELAKMRDAGWRPDYYVMDAGWFDPKGDYTDYIRPAWPNGPRPMVDAIHRLGIKYGLWFDVGGGIPDNPGVQPSRKPDGRLCMAPGPYIATFKKALTKQIEELGLTMVKFDFATFDCGSNQHGHLSGDYATEASLTGFLDMLDAVRKEHPQTKYIIFNGFHRSPWWLMHVDTIYSSDPAPSDTPSLHLRDSVNLRTDITVQSHRFDHLLPWYAIDDCGLMIGRTGTIYWIGAEEVRKTWVLNIGRGGMMPFIYGDLRLLDDSDRRFIARIWALIGDNPEVFVNTRAILGQVNGEEVYGYSHFKGQHGFVFLSNPTFEQKPVVLKLDSSLGLTASGQSPLGVSEIFPVECTYAAADAAGFAPGSEVRMELAPFEVRALEINAATAAVAGAVPPRRSRHVSVPVPTQLAAKSPEWLTDTLMDSVNKEQSHLASSTTAKVEPPKELTRSGLKGIYSFSVELPKFDGSRTLALPIRFMAGGNPIRNDHPTKCVLAAAWSGSRQIMLDVTPEYGRTIWSGCSWLTFHAKLDPSLSGAKVEALALNLSIEGVRLEMSKAYLLEDTP
jgi:hypothetical protein